MGLGRLQVFIAWSHGLAVKPCLVFVLLTPDVSGLLGAWEDVSLHGSHGLHNTAGVGQACLTVMPESERCSLIYGASITVPLVNSPVNAHAALTYTESLLKYCCQLFTQRFVWIFVTENVILTKKLLRFAQEKNIHTAEDLPTDCQTVLQVSVQILYTFNVKSSGMSYFIPLLYTFHTCCIQKICNEIKNLPGNRTVLPSLAPGLPS